MKTQLRCLVKCYWVLVLLLLCSAGFSQTTLNPTADTDAQSDVAAGTNTTLATSQWNTLYSKFNLSAVTGTVTNAKLKLYKTDAQTATLYVKYASPDSWVEGGTKPTAGADIANIVLPAVAGYVELDVTNAVNTELAGDKLISFAINTSVGNWIYFYSRQNTANKPQLVLTTSQSDTQAPTVPGTPAASNVTQTSCTLTWTASTDNVAVTGYNIYQGATLKGTSTTNSFSVTGLSCGTAYSFTVRATDAAGNLSAASTAANVTTSACAGAQTINPNADTDAQSDVAAGTNTTLSASQWNTMYLKFTLSTVSGTISNAKLKLYKTDAQTATLYINYASPDTWVEGGTKPTAGAAITSITLPAVAGYVEADVTAAVNTEVAGDKVISFAVTTSVGNWISFNSRENAANKPQLVVSASGTGGSSDTQAPTVPTGLAASGIGQTSCTLNWTASTDNVGVTSYDIYQGSTFKGSSTTTSFSATGLVCATAYSFTVRAKDAAGNISAASTAVNVTTSACSTGSGSMAVGTNFWNIGWMDRLNYFKSGVNWTTVTDPWNPQFLADIAPFTNLRFMDFLPTNNSTVITWSQRVQKTADHYTTDGVAIEWMIDLCNRTNKDMWICVPHQADANYFTQLATLIKNTLNANLKVYIEYSNETWNGGFTQFNYTIQQGQAAGLPGSNQWYQGGAYSIWQSLKIFKAFRDVYGTAMASRVIRVCSFSGNFDIFDQGYSSVVNSTTWNPFSEQADVIAVAPYVGNGLDGSSASIQSQFHNEIINTLNTYVIPAKAIANKYGKPLICYEGGQHLLTNADVWSRNPLIYNEYLFMLDQWKPYISFFSHYCLYGVAQSGGAWGSKEGASQALADAHKYRALINWISANPPGGNTGARMGHNSTPAPTVTGIKVFPNPVSGSDAFVLLGSDKKMNYRVMVINNSGATIQAFTQSVEIGNNTVRIPVSQLAKGVYYLKFVGGTKPIVQKIIVK